MQTRIRKTQKQDDTSPLLIEEPLDKSRPISKSKKFRIFALVFACILLFIVGYYTIDSYLRKAINQTLLDVICKYVSIYVVPASIQCFRLSSRVVTDYKIGRDGYSQFGQDVFLLKLFRGKRDLVFVDVGANEGVIESNTYMLERCLGWKGLCFEPLPSRFQYLISQRRCTAFKNCVAEKEGTVTMIDAGYMSSVEEYTPKYHKFRQVTHIKDRFNATCVVLKNVLRDYGVDKIDYLSIDVEGAEIYVLRGIDFSKVKIKVISVENTYNMGEVHALMRKNGFRFKYVVGIDSFFVHESFEEEFSGVNFDGMKFVTTIQNK